LAAFYIKDSQQKRKKNNYVSIIHLTMNILQYCNAKQQGSSISLFEIRSICIVPGLVLVWGVESVKAIINSVWIYLDSQNSHERQLHISMSFPWKCWMIAWFPTPQSKEQQKDLYF